MATWVLSDRSESEEELIQRCVVLVSHSSPTRRLFFGPVFYLSVAVHDIWDPEGVLTIHVHDRELFVTPENIRKHIRCSNVLHEHQSLFSPTWVHLMMQDDVAKKKRETVQWMHEFAVCPQGLVFVFKRSVWTQTQKTRTERQQLRLRSGANEPNSRCEKDFLFWSKIILLNLDSDLRMQGFFTLQLLSPSCPIFESAGRRVCPL